MTDEFATDADLMREVARGRRDAMESLIRRHGSDVLTLIRRMTDHIHRPEDIFQDVFLAVWLNRHQYQYPRAVKPWLLKIAANKCREHSRTGRRRAWSLEDYAPVTTDGPDASLISRETSDVIAACVAKLPENQRLVLTLRIWNGMSYAEIAKVTERSEGTVRSNMHHALKHLRETLQTRLQ